MILLILIFILNLVSSMSAKRSECSPELWLWEKGPNSLDIFKADVFHVLENILKVTRMAEHLEKYGSSPGGKGLICAGVSR